jgi:hypothetical protein
VIALHCLPEGLCPSDSPTRSLAGARAPRRSPGSLATLVRLLTFLELVVYTVPHLRRR